MRSSPSASPSTRSSSARKTPSRSWAYPCRTSRRGEPSGSSSAASSRPSTRSRPTACPCASSRRPSPKNPWTSRRSSSRRPICWPGPSASPSPGPVCRSRSSTGKIDLENLDLTLTPGPARDVVTYSIGRGDLSVKDKDGALLLATGLSSSGTLGLVSPFSMDATFTFGSPRFVAGGDRAFARESQLGRRGPLGQGRPGDDPVPSEARRPRPSRRRGNGRGEARLRPVPRGRRPGPARKPRSRGRSLRSEAARRAPGRGTERTGRDRGHVRPTALEPGVEGQPHRLTARSKMSSSTLSSAVTASMSAPAAVSTLQVPPRTRVWRPISGSPPAGWRSPA